MRVYFNEFDSGAAAWLRELMKDGLLPEGVVDERSIVDVQPRDLAGFDQCHFFAGIGGWPLALQLANWNPTRPVWTGSCPCQPFSAAGKRRGTADERHLWPEFFRLIRKCRPATIFGEQVASKDGRNWLSGVRADLEGVAYAVGAADLCAAGVGAPHIRQRLYWVADSDQGQRGRLADGEGRQLDGQATGRQQGNGVAQSGGHVGGLGDTDEQGPQGRIDGPGKSGRADQRAAGPAGVAGGVEHAEGDGRQQRGAEPSGRGAASGCGNGFWSRAEWLACADGKARRIEPGIFPLAHGIPGRVGLLRGAGNAIVPQVAATFIEAYLNT